jgi:hypothetical protein
VEAAEVVEFIQRAAVRRVRQPAGKATQAERGWPVEQVPVVAEEGQARRERLPAAVAQHPVRVVPVLHGSMALHVRAEVVVVPTLQPRQAEAAEVVVAAVRAPQTLVVAVAPVLVATLQAQVAQAS